MSAQQLVQILRSGVGARRLFSLTTAEMRGVVATCRVDGGSPSRRPWEAREYELLRDALYNHYTKVYVGLVSAVTITDLNSEVQTIFFSIPPDAPTLLDVSRFKSYQFPALDEELGGVVVQKCWAGKYKSTDEVVRELKEMNMA
jgi:hypothetical protein